MKINTHWNYNTKYKTFFTLKLKSSGPRAKILFKMGTKNAAVFPDPVWAHAITSRPPIIIGIANFCVKPKRVIVSNHNIIDKSYDLSL